VSSERAHVISNIAFVILVDVLLSGGLSVWVLQTEVVGCHHEVYELLHVYVN